MQNHFNLRIGPTERLVANINAGKRDFFGIVRHEDSLCLFTQRRLLPIVHLKMELMAGSRSYQATEKDFQGQILLGRNYDHDSVDIVSFSDETMSDVLFSSGEDILTGSLLIIAAPNVNAESSAFTVTAVFNRGKGGLLFAPDDTLARYAYIVSTLVDNSKSELALVGEVVQHNV